MDSLENAQRVVDRYTELAEAARRQADLAPPVVRDSDVQMIPVSEAEGMKGGDAADKGDAEEATKGDNEADHQPITPWAKGLADMSISDRGDPIGHTAAGCVCDDQVKCGRQGKSFNWCRVGGAEQCVLLRRDNSTMLDPGGADHNLYHANSKWGPSRANVERISTAWDYCTPKPGPVPNGSPLTAHGGICQWRSDLLFRYGEDPKYRSHKGVLNKFGMPAMNLKLVPMQDRLALEAMIQYRADPQNCSLCSETESSHPFSVCPTVPDPRRPDMGSRGWLAGRSWDYCTQRDWKPPSLPGGGSPGGLARRGGGGELGTEPGPLAPAMPQRVAIGPEDTKQEEEAETAEAEKDMAEQAEVEVKEAEKEDAELLEAEKMAAEALPTTPTVKAPVATAASMTLDGLVALSAACHGNTSTCSRAIVCRLSADKAASKSCAQVRVQRRRPLHATLKSVALSDFF